MEESKGGANSEENAIALCVTCHIDVHTKAPFTRRFSKQELVGHRDTIYEMVSNDSLVEPDDADEVAGNLFAFGSIPTGNQELGSLASRLLVEAARKEDNIMMCKALGSVVLQAGSFSDEIGYGRKLAEAEDAIDQLVSIDLIKPIGYKDEIWSLSLLGYQMADEIMASSV